MSKDVNRTTKTGIVLGLGMLGLLGFWGGWRVVAYFSTQGQSSLQNFTTGLMSIGIESNPANSLSNFMPGEERFLSWMIQNTGSAPIFLKVKLDGRWVSPIVDTLDLEISRLEYLANDTWITLPKQNLPLREEFLLAESGEEASLTELAPGDSFEVRALVKLPISISNEYQNSQLELQLHAAARQVTAGAAWPVEY